MACYYAKKQVRMVAKSTMPAKLGGGREWIPNIFLNGVPARELLRRQLIFWVLLTHVKLFKVFSPVWSLEELGKLVKPEGNKSLKISVRALLLFKYVIHQTTVES